MWRMRNALSLAYTGKPRLLSGISRAPFCSLSQTQEVRRRPARIVRSGQPQLMEVQLTSGKAPTSDDLRACANGCLDFFTPKLQPDGSYDGLDDLSYYCKIPNALIYGGRIDEADKVMDYIVNRYMTPNGDFMTCPGFKTLHPEFVDFYPYANQWWITSGMRLGRFDFVPRAMEYCDRWWNPETKASTIHFEYRQGAANENCVFNTAHLGLSYLYTGQMEKAIACGDTIRKMVLKQPDISRVFYQRFDDNFEFFTKFPYGHVGAAIGNTQVFADKPKQCWWSLGYPAAFSAILYQATSDIRYLETAELVLDFAMSCNPDIRNNIVAHKVMWASSTMGYLTRQQKYWDFALEIGNTIVNAQNMETGAIDKWGWTFPAQVYDQTGEIAYWLYVVAQLMDKSGRNRTLGNMAERTESI